MTNTIDFASAKQHVATEAYKVSTSKGERRGELSSQWFSRPDDQRYTSLEEMYKETKDRSERSRVATIDAKNIRVNASFDDPERLDLDIVDLQKTVKPNHWSFGQVCSLTKAPASYLRTLPAPIAGINLQYGLDNVRSEQVKVFATHENDDIELRAITGPEYGRIHDHTIIKGVMNMIAESKAMGRADWKVPGVLDWGLGYYNPFVDVTKATTTLFKSDRDIFLFLCDDKHPIEIGKLPDGNPDLLFRGFYCWNSEVGDKKCGIATMYLRAVCQNRNLWGVEGFQEISMRHSKFAPERFIREAMPALNTYANSNTQRVIAGVLEAKKIVVAETLDDQREFLLKRSFSRGAATDIIQRVTKEEGHAPKSIWDFVQGITSRARDITRQDERIVLEKEAGKLLNGVKVA